MDDFMAYTGQDSNEYSYALRRSSKTLSDHSGTQTDALTGEIILTKEGGAEDVINIDDLRRKLSHLKENAHVKIRKLSGELKDDFDSLAQYVAWIYNTDSYPLLYAEIQDYFHEDNVYQPGTVGAYCGGCLVKRKDGLLSRGCAVICAGSIPPPYDDPDWDFCSDLVIWATYNGESYEFTTLNEIDDEQDNKAIIFIEQDSLESFPGLSEAEKNTLRDHGLDQVRLVYYNPEREPMYTEVSEGFVSLDQIRSRATNPNLAPIIVNNSWNWWMIVIIAFILIALFLLLCRA